jgi:hypothetical protein
MNIFITYDDNLHQLVAFQPEKLEYFVVNGEHDQLMKLYYRYHSMYLHAAILNSICCLRDFKNKSGSIRNLT